MNYCLSTNLACNVPGINVALKICVNFSFGSITMSNFFTSSAKVIIASFQVKLIIQVTCIANFCPMQFLGPPEKGMYENGCLLWEFFASSEYEFLKNRNSTRKSVRIELIRILPNILIDMTGCKISTNRSTLRNMISQYVA